MEINEIISEDLIVFDQTINTKQKLFEYAADIFFKNGIIKNKKKFIKALEKREKEVSTGIEDNFGMPHAKSKSILRPALAFFHTNEIRDYFAIDGSYVKFSFIIAVPEHGNELHLDILSQLARRLMDDSFRDALKNAKSKRDILSIIK